MKKRLLVMLLLLGCIAQAQNNKEQLPSQELIFKQATQYLHGTGGKPYNPEKALSLNLQNAKQGNVKAMYVLGLQYSKGIGVPASMPAALEWFNRAAENGYLKAWCNLGDIYRKGPGADIDYSKAYTYYEKAAAGGDLSGKYNIAYLAYKGIGCTQNYTQAFSLFYETALKGYAPGMYFTGLCFRNGYGVPRNNDSARHYLMLAALHGSAQAKAELSIKDPENPVHPPATPSLVQSFMATQFGTGNSQYHRIQHNVQATEIGGEYKGYVIKYDWSGTHVIGYSNVKVNLALNGLEVSGTWSEDDSLSTAVHALFTDSALLFNNTGYSRIYHYSPFKPETFTFQKAQLQLVHRGDSIYIAGNLQLYSIDRTEPGKPFSVLLFKSAPAQINNQFPISAVSLLKAYPNPFNQVTTISFRLEKEAAVALSVTDINGKTIYKEAPEKLLPGTFNRQLPLSAPAGTYVVQLITNGVSKSIMVVKQ